MMSGDRAALRWTGGFGLAAAVLLMVTAPLYASMGSAPSPSNSEAFIAYLTQNQAAAVTTKLIDALYAVGLIVFAAGLRHLIARASDRLDWVAALVFGLALAASSVFLFGDVLGAAAALDTYSTPDASAVRALTEASLPAFGAIYLIVIASFLLATGGSILASHALPRWTGWAGLAAGVLNIAAAPTIYGGGDYLWSAIAGVASGGPYSYAIVVAGLALTVWQGSVSIVMIWRGFAGLSTQRAKAIATAT